MDAVLLFYSQPSSFVMSSVGLSTPQKHIPSSSARPSKQSTPFLEATDSPPQTQKNNSSKLLKTETLKTPHMITTPKHRNWVFSKALSRSETVGFFYLLSRWCAFANTAANSDQTQRVESRDSAPRYYSDSTAPEARSPAKSGPLRVRVVRNVPWRAGLGRWRNEREKRPGDVGNFFV